MDLANCPEHEKFRAEVREFLQQTRAQWQPYRAMGRASSETRRWRALLIERGYTARSIPREYDGHGGETDVLQSHIIAEEFAPSVAPGGLALPGWGVQADRWVERGGGYR